MERKIENVILWIANGLNLFLFIFWWGLFLSSLGKEANEIAVNKNILLPFAILTVLTVILSLVATFSKKKNTKMSAILLGVSAFLAIFYFNLLSSGLWIIVIVLYFVRPMGNSNNNLNN